MKPTIHTDKYDLYCADCLTVMREMEAQSVDAILTDIPYGTTACAWDEIIPFAPMWEGVKRVLKPRGVFVTTASQPFTSKLVMSNLEWFDSEIIWEKERPSNIFLMHKQTGKCHENIEVFCDGSPLIYNPIKTRNGKHRTREAMQKYVGNKLKHHSGDSVTSYRSDWDGTKSMPRSVLYFPRDVGEDNHPTQKPVALYKYLAATYTNPGDTILDIACGSGTTGVACMQLGRRFVGVEISEQYFEIAAKRIEQAAKQGILLLDQPTKDEQNYKQSGLEI